MEWLNKIPNWIKIPVKVLLPALTIFSGLLLFLGDNAIEALHMAKFREESGFSFGLIFIITLSLELVYAIYYFLDKYKEYSITKKLANRILKGNEMEFFVLAALYNEPKKSALFPMNDGLIARLEGKRYISKFTQTVDYTMRLTYFMQPFVEWAFDYIFNKTSKEEQRLKKKIAKCKDDKKIEMLEEELQRCKQFNEQLKTVSINTFYDQSSIFD